MATTTNFGWETPDDTDLVKDGALAIRTLGSAIDTSLVDLKGGTTGQVLSKASNTDMDFNWTTISQSYIGCGVYKASAQSISNNTVTAVTWDAEDFDSDAFHSTSTNTSRLTIPSGKAGKYLITGTLFWSGSDLDESRSILIYKNGAIWRYIDQMQAVNVTNRRTGQSFSTVMDLAVADYVEIYAWQTSGSSLDLTHDFNLITFASISRLGA